LAAEISRWFPVFKVYSSFSFESFVAYFVASEEKKWPEHREE